MFNDVSEFHKIRRSRTPYSERLRKKINFRYNKGSRQTFKFSYQGDRISTGLQGVPERFRNSTNRDFESNCWFSANVAKVRINSELLIRAGHTALFCAAEV
ncbi:hypothetical protein AVEN_163724-1 [Araneus ventricosus]|uniref:Uncharacterized protein n=1 Tax=Araneus ventricosus TaxID=182803 RepID=A0A4Y2I1G6_ARAVE|nr:hypothetical protein AVEN_163724-1 [Araneus ventricosus]